eukprot:gene14370-19272_t
MDIEHSEKETARSQYIQPKQSIIFSGVKFEGYLASSLMSLNMTNPTTIQSASLPLLVSGLSCILHSQTGSGKTLAYILPLLKRMSYEKEGVQAVIVVPTKELAVQVASDICALVGDSIDELVQLCITSTKTLKASEFTAPIIVGTPYKLMDAFVTPYLTKTNELSNEPTHPLRNVNYLVLDEVDRLVSALSKYATDEDKKSMKSFENPSVEFLKKLLKLRRINNELQLQIVASSATVGRPLRRELSRLVNADSSVEHNVELHVVRPIQTVAKESNLFTIENNNNSENNDEKGDDSVSTSNRMVSIPTDIKHILLIDDVDDESNDISKKIITIKEKWMNIINKNSNNNNKDSYHNNLQRALVFVPTVDDVKKAVGMLEYFKLNNVINLQNSLGIEIIPTQSAKSNRFDRSFQGHANNKNMNKIDFEIQTPQKTSQIVSLARKSNVGTASISKNNDNNSQSSEIYVAHATGMRGLHLQDVSNVFVLKPPKTMDEYLHLAGRTGRTGNKVIGGNVYTIVTLEELKRMQSWQRPLGIIFDVAYAL